MSPIACCPAGRARRAAHARAADGGRVIGADGACHQPPRACSAVMRPLILLLLATALVSAAEATLTPEALHGMWVPDAKAATAAQKPALEAAGKVEGYGITFTARICRVVLGGAEDQQYAGQWRLDGAKPGGAVLVVQPKGGEERRLTLVLSGARLTVDGGLPLIKAPR